jgi:pimeloyl-ACP methyl ester carboxylesterase
MAHPVIRPDAADHVTPYDRFGLSDVEVESLLACGARRQELAAYFGDGEYAELARLARAAERQGPGWAQPHVLLMPGIMGSQLGLKRRPPIPDDVLWLDPIDIQSGRLALLGLETPRPIIPLGVVLYSYLKLKLRLRAAGFAVTTLAYDWRSGIEEAAGALAAHLRALAPRPIALVAHSMGGLIARAALAQPEGRYIERVVLLGTPNLGSFAAVQALRGTYPVVRKIVRLDPAGLADRLAAEVFNTFPSLYQLLPSPECNGRIDLFDPQLWPQSGPQPRRELLEGARRFRAALPAPDPRMIAIVGVGEETVTSAHREHDDFVYTVTRRGDGTVPAASAALPGGASYFTRVAHSELTRDAAVAAAIADLLLRGSTQRLPSSWHSASRAQARISDGELRRAQTRKVDWAQLTAEERREFLQNLNEPPRLKLRVPARARRARRGRLAAARRR